MPFGQDRPPLLLIGDADTVTRMIEDAARHVPDPPLPLIGAC